MFHIFHTFSYFSFPFVLFFPKVEKSRGRSTSFSIPYGLGIIQVEVLSVPVSESLQRLAKEACEGLRRLVKRPAGDVAKGLAKACEGLRRLGKACKGLGRLAKACEVGE